MAIHRWDRNSDRTKATSALSDSVDNPSVSMEILRPVWTRNSSSAANRG